MLLNLNWSPLKVSTSKFGRLPKLSPNSGQDTSHGTLTEQVSLDFRERQGSLCPHDNTWHGDSYTLDYK